MAGRRFSSRGPAAMSVKLKLEALDVELAVCRLGAEEALPAWSTSSGFFSVSRTSDELSIVCAEEGVPPGVKAEKGWRAIRVAGPLEFSLTGVLASIANPLARARISVFAISTFDTDYVLVKGVDLKAALEALAASGHDCPGLAA